MPFDPQKSVVLSIPASVQNDKMVVVSALQRLDQATFRVLLARLLQALPIDARATLAAANAEFEDAAVSAHSLCGTPSATPLSAIADRYQKFNQHVHELVHVAQHAFVNMVQHSRARVTDQEQQEVRRSLEEWHAKFKSVYPSSASMSTASLPSHALASVPLQNCKQTRKLARKAARVERKLEKLQCRVSSVSDPAHEAARIVRDVQRKAAEYAKTLQPLTLMPYQCAPFIYTARLAVL